MATARQNKISATGGGISVLKKKKLRISVNGGGVSILKKKKNR